MAKQENTPRNSFKPEKPEKTEVQEKKQKAPKTPESEDSSALEKVKKISGLALLLLALFLIISFTSYLFSWKCDQNLVYSLGTLNQAIWTLNPELAQNWAGLVGAYTANLFIGKWFGISSFLFAVLAFIIGFKFFFDHSLASIRKALSNMLFIVFWLSVALGFSLHDVLEILGGGFGFYAQQWLSGVLGTAGTGIFLVFSLMAYLMVAFNVNFFLPKFIKEKLDTAPVPIENETEQEEDEEVTNETDEGEEINETGEVVEEDEEEPTDDELVLIDKSEPVVEEIIPEVETEESDIQEIEFHPGRSFIPEIQDPNENVDFVVEMAEKNDENGIEGSASEEFSAYDPALDLSNYKFPGIELLKDYGESEGKIDKDELEEKKNLIVQTLRNYKIEIEKIKATVGSTVTLYEIIPQAGVKISKIKNLEDDIALSLSALGIRIIAPLPGRGTIGIEVPNDNPEIVSVRSVIGSSKFRNSNMELPFVLGRTISNEVFMADLAKMPHLLIAGATGQGKSVGLNVIISSLLYKKHPSQVKFVFVDPKKVELSLYKNLEKHFLAKLPDSSSAIITDISQVVDTLKSLIAEMEARYLLLEDAHVRNIIEYNDKFTARKLSPREGHRFLPYIVLVIDELADLMMQAGKEIELPIARLAQMARAIGIHLILATQRPSVNIITGTIKANFPARIAFKVRANVDSRTILDSKGAEQLVGKGDMLFSTGGDLIRIQCAFVDTNEVENVVDFISKQQSYGEAMLLPEVKSENDIDDDDTDIDDLDSMFEDAARIVVQHQQGSTSLLQRRLKLGYNRAGRIIDQLEKTGIVGPFEGSKARQVLVQDLYALEQILSSLSRNQ